MTVDTRAADDSVTAVETESGVVGPTASAPTNITPAEIEAGLLFSDYYWGAGQFTYSIPGLSSTWAGYEAGREPDAGYRPLSGTEAGQFRAAMSLVDSYIAPRFVETDDLASPGNIRIAFSSHPDLSSNWGYATTPSYLGGTPHPRSGDIWVRSDMSGFDVGSYNWQALLHEIGHAMGVKHPFEAPTLPVAYDTRRYTLLSYTDQADRLQLVFTRTETGANLDFKAVNPTSMMVLDIAALQARYGADTTTAAGATTYRFDQSAAFFHTIYDAGGNDTLNVANFTRGSVIDLTPGAYSSLGYWSEADQMAAQQAAMPEFSGWIAANYELQAGKIWTWSDNVGIAFSTVIENAVGGSGDDRITGNAVANVLSGGAGADTLSGEGGDDRLDGGLGADVLRGGAGVDVADYRARTPGVTVTLDGDNAVLLRVGAAVEDTLSGVESVWGALGADKLTGDGLANLFDGGAGNDTLLGRGGDDTLLGKLGNDVLEGGDGADRLDGGEGVDTAAYTGATAGVMVKLGVAGAQNTGGAGSDTLIAIENLTGSAFADVLTGGTGANVLNGGAGADRLIGGDGADNLMGGTGADTFVYVYLGDSDGGAFDRITDLAAGDVIDLRLIDADVLRAGNSAFSRIANDAAFTGAGQLRLSLHGGDTWLELNTDADADAEATVLLTGDYTDEGAHAGWLL